MVERAANSATHDATRTRRIIESGLEPAVREIPLIGIAQPLVQRDARSKTDFVLRPFTRANPEPRRAQRNLLARHETRLPRDSCGKITKLGGQANERHR